MPAGRRLLAPADRPQASEARTQASGATDRSQRPPQDRPIPLRRAVGDHATGGATRPRPHDSGPHGGPLSRLPGDLPRLRRGEPPGASERLAPVAAAQGDGGPTGARGNHVARRGPAPAPRRPRQPKGCGSRGQPAPAPRSVTATPTPNPRGSSRARGVTDIPGGSPTLAPPVRPSASVALGVGGVVGSPVPAIVGGAVRQLRSWGGVCASSTVGGVRHGSLCGLLLGAAG